MAMYCAYTSFHERFFMPFITLKKNFSKKLVFERANRVFKNNVTESAFFFSPKPT